MHAKSLALICGLSAAIAFPAAAVPISIDFEGVTNADISADTLVISTAAGNVTFTGVGLRIRDLPSSFPLGNVLSTTGDTQPITVTFAPGVELLYAEVENRINGRFTSEVDVIVANAFDATSTVLDTETSSATILRMDGPGITRLTYDDSTPTTGYVLDNFVFEVADSVPVPAPAALLLLGTALAGLTTMRRRA